jgi:hypothetical protein
MKVVKPKDKYRRISTDYSVIFTMGPDQIINEWFRECFDNYMFRRRIIVSDYFAVKSIHAFPSYVIVDLGHTNIRFYVLHDYQIIETSFLGFGGIDISLFFVTLIRENKKKIVFKESGGVSIFA